MSKWHVCHSHGGFTDIAAQISLTKLIVGVNSFLFLEEPNQN